jgi:hypothetical protein
MHAGEHPCVHVEREGGGRTALGQFLSGDGVAEEAHSPPAKRLEHGQAKEACLAEGGIVFDRGGGVAVMLGCTGGKVGGKRTGQAVDTLPIWSQDKFHGDPPDGLQPWGNQGKTINETLGGEGSVLKKPAAIVSDIPCQL